MYRVGKQEDVAALRELSRLCFGDSDEFLDLFYSARFRPEQCFVWEGEGEIAAFAFALPLTLKLTDETLPAAYIYSVGTHPDYREKGLASGLMDFIWKELTARGVKIALLVPAGEGLFDFYGRLGFRPLTNIASGARANVCCRSCCARSMSVEPATPAEYFELREKLLADTPHFVWDIEDLRYQGAFSGLVGGGLYLVGDGAGCAVMESGPRGVVLKELLAPAEIMADGVEAFANSRVRGASTEVRTTVGMGSAIGLAQQTFTMARWTADVPEAKLKGIYFGLALD